MQNVMSALPPIATAKAANGNRILKNVAGREDIPRRAGFASSSTSMPATKETRVTDAVTHTNREQRWKANQ
jgi:hypothetical protein